MSHELHLVSTLKALPLRREPYWSAPVGDGLHVGFRSRGGGNGTWIARLHDDTEGRHKYRSLGVVSKDFSYAKARDAALQWAKDRNAGVTDRPPTVADACREYVTELEAEGRGATVKGDRRKDPHAVPGSGTAHDAEMRFRRNVYKHPLGKTPLDKVRTTKIKAWRNALDMAPATRNRELSNLKAALNLAVEHRRVNPSVAQEWRDVKPLKGAGRRRGVYLDLKQRQALLAACEGALRDLIEAAVLTGSRPGELVKAVRSQFDARTGTMTFEGKTGRRSVPLSPAAVTLFRRLAKGKLPTAYLLTRDDGKPWQHSDWDELVRDAAKAAKLPAGVVLYTLRHSWITQALLQGMATLDVARLVGTSLAMIEKYYGHLVADAARERLAKVTML